MEAPDTDLVLMGINYVCTCENIQLIKAHITQPAIKIFLAESLSIFD